MLLLDELPAMQTTQVLVSEAADDFRMMPSAKGGIRQPEPPPHTKNTAHHHHHHQRAENVLRFELLFGSRLNSRGSSAEVALIEEN